MWQTFVLFVDGQYMVGNAIVANLSIVFMSGSLEEYVVSKIVLIYGIISTITFHRLKCGFKKHNDEHGV